jgi:2-polyprenyl-6-methoxyphenol hydroxylase-like FAD-dependent oxidoreductase
VHEIRTQRAIVIGGSLGGLLAAHQLRAIGWDVDVFERTGDDLADRGAGIGTHPALFTAMRRAGLSLDMTNCTEPRTYVCLDRDNRLIHEAPAHRTMTAWSRLYRPLRDNLPPGSYHNGMLLMRVETDNDAATAVFADGSRVTADLLVGADGFRSTVRSHVLPDLNPAYAGYIAWRALAPEADLPPATWDAIKRVYIFCVPEGELLVSYAVPTRDEDSAKGRLSFNIVWYRPANDAALADLCTDTSGRSHSFSIPPPLIRPEVVSAMKASAHALLAPPMADVIERTAQPFFQPIYDLASPRVAIGRVVLLGDAAFVARPHVGAGVTKAALDAMCLADSIRSAGPDLTAALAHYDREQRCLGDWCVARGRQMGVRIRSRLAGEAAPSASELDRRAVMSIRDYIETADDIEKLTNGRHATVDHLALSAVRN